MLWHVFVFKSVNFLSKNKFESKTLKDVDVDGYVCVCVCIYICILWLMIMVANFLVFILEIANNRLFELCYEVLEAWKWVNVEIVKARFNWIKVATCSILTRTVKSCNFHQIWYANSSRCLLQLSCFGLI